LDRNSQTLESKSRSKHFREKQLTNKDDNKEIKS